MIKYMSTEEVASYLGVHVNTVLNHIKSGRVPAYKIGRQYRIRLDELESSMEKVTPSANAR